VSALTTAEGAGQQTEITNQQTSLNAQLSAFGTFSSALSTLQATVTTLASPTALAGFTATVADNTIATATTTPQAVAGQYTLAVQNLATAASLSSAPVLGADTAIGTGTLQISVGNQSTSVTIDSTNDTLAGIAAAINAAPNNPGVSASVLSTTAGERLVISGTETGAANAITVAETDGGTGLSSLTCNPLSTTNSLTQTQQALDANFTVNGYAATSASNVVSSAISGVSFTLLAPTAPATSSTPAATTTLTIAPDTSAAQSSIGTFVTAVNGVLSAIQSLGGYNASTQTAGPLNGNATLEAFQDQLENILDTVNSTSSGGAASLADLGITADANTGQFDSNTTTLANALSSNLTAVGNLLGGTNGIATQLNGLLTSYTGPDGLLSTITQGLQTSLSNVSQQQTALNAQLAAYSATLTAQYNAMDTAVAALKETQTYLNAEFNPSANQSSSGQSASSSLNAGTTST